MKWISVKERMPEKDDRYLVIIRYEYLDSKPFSVIYATNYYESCCCSQIGFHYFKEMAISNFSSIMTHWAELSEPPKEQE